MSEKQAPQNKSGGRAFRAWIVALALFMALVIVTLALVPSFSGYKVDRLAGKVEKQIIDSTDDIFEPGYIMTSLPELGGISAPSPDFDGHSEYVLTAFGLQGLYQESPVNMPWRLDMPKKRFEAQLIRRGPTPEPVTGGVKLGWKLDAASNAGNGTIIFASASGDMLPDEESRSFSAEIDAVVHLENPKEFNPYPVLTVRAEDASTGRVLAESAAVLSMSPGFGCGHCHADPDYGILELHDKRNGTNLKNMAQQDEETVYCKSCHMDTSFEDGKYESGAIPCFSAAIHGWHAPYLREREADACLTCHIGLARPKNEKGTRPQAMFMRDIHLVRGLNCVNCHGYMEDHAIALLRAEQEGGMPLAGRNIKRVEPRGAKNVDEVKPRIAWMQEPDCTGCHDFENKPEIYGASAFNKWTEDAGGADLFSRRTDFSGAVRCTSCHGAPHATYPAKNPVSEDRDNIQPLQYQGHARVLGAVDNCAVCHTQSMDFSIHHPLVEREYVQIHVPDNTVLMMPPVKFAHESHTPLIDCATCHHTGAQSKCVSSGCHDIADEENAQGAEGYRYFRQAFHGRDKSCEACHTSRQEQGLPAGPVGCQDCHLEPSRLWSD